MTLPRETQPGGYHPEAPSRSFFYTRAIDDYESSIPTKKGALGGKGWSLVEMSRLGLPVPPGFILTTGAWCEFQAAHGTIPDHIENENTRQLLRLEQSTKKHLGDPNTPLLVSVRSGAPPSMPGAMITILNIGINDTTVHALARDIGEKQAWKAYLNMMIRLGTHAYGLNRQAFDNLRRDTLEHHQLSRLTDLPLVALQSLVADIKTIYKRAGHEFPQDARVQVDSAINAVFRSWNSPEARAYRQLHAISEDIGTAAIVQEMVWGNSKKEGAGAGVIFTRDVRELGETPVVFFAPHAQGSVVVGTRGDYESKPISDLPLPENIREQITRYARLLQDHFRHPQDIEFTYDGTDLWILQSRDLRLAPPAQFRWLLTCIRNAQTTTEEAKRRITPSELQKLLLPDLDPASVAQAKLEGRLIATGRKISLGIGAGRVVRSIQEAQTQGEKPVVLIVDTLQLIDLAQLPPNVVALVAGNGGAGSHIGVQASLLDIPVVFAVAVERFEGLNMVTVDGNAGEIFSGVIPIQTDGVGKILTADERAIVERWYRERIQNPWRFAGPEPPAELYDKAQQALDRAKAAGLTGPKTLEYAVLYALVPANICMPYETISIKSKDLLAIAAAGKRISERLRNSITATTDATIRTCLRQRGQGTAPWWYLTNEEDIQSLFTDPTFSARYGNLPGWLGDENLSEVLVGTVPKGKLDPEIQKQECAWALSCGETGEVTLQITFFTAHHRDFDTVHSQNLFSATYHYDPESGALIQEERTLDEALESNVFVKNMVDFVQGTVMEWWHEHHLQRLLAAATDVFADTTIPVLEGQARIDPEEEEQRWCFIYGLKADPKK